MPSYPCAIPTCEAYVPARGGTCEEHGNRGGVTSTSRHAYYDQHLRDKEAKAFYDSAAWQRARATKLANNPTCERCEVVFAQHVHHKIPLRRCTLAQKTAQDNLTSLCQPCHSAVERELSHVR
jgi:5-methylcytosine-specific restriction protein A